MPCRPRSRALASAPPRNTARYERLCVRVRRSATSPLRSCRSAARVSPVTTVSRKPGARLQTPPGWCPATPSSHRLASRLYAVETLLPSASATWSARTPSGRAASSQVTWSTARAVLNPRRVLRGCVAMTVSPRLQGQPRGEADHPGVTAALQREALCQRAAHLAHPRGAQAAARVAELELGEQALPRDEVLAAVRRVHPCPERVDVAGGHHGLAQPGIELLARLDDARRLGVGEQRAGVGLGRL